MRFGETMNQHCQRGGTNPAYDAKHGADLGDCQSCCKYDADMYDHIFDDFICETCAIDRYEHIVCEWLVGNGFASLEEVEEAKIDVRGAVSGELESVSVDWKRNGFDWEHEFVLKELAVIAND